MESTSSQGIKLFEQGKYKDAIYFFDKAIEINPKDGDYWNNKGDAFNNLNKYEEALKCYDKAIEINPKDGNYWNRKGKAFYDLHKYEEALKCYDKAIEINPNNDVYWTRKANAFCSLKKYEEALKCYDKAIEINPNNDVYWNNKGSAFYNLNKYEEALKCYDKAIEINPKDGNYWNRKGKAFYDLHKYEEALKCYDKAIEINPKDGNYWNRKGKAFYDLHKYEEALKCYDKAIEINPKDGNYWNRKGKAFYDLHKYEEALKCYDKAIEINPKDGNYWAYKAIAFREQTQYENALKCFNNALAINNNNSYFWSGKGEVFNRMGHYKDAIDCQQKAISIEPFGFCYFRLGKAQQNLGKQLEALESYKNCLKIDPNQDSLQTLTNKENVCELIAIACKQFLAKLNDLEAFLWGGKYTMLQRLYQEEIGQYSQYILQFLMNETEFQQINIETKNAIKTQFATLSFGRYKNEKIVVKNQELGFNSHEQDFLAILREIAILAFCNHENIIPIRGIYFSKDAFSISIIMPQYYADLFSVLFGSNKAIIPNKKEICCQLIEALIYIHKAGLIHLDLKLQNILFENSELKRIALLDFGISKIPKDLSKSTDILGISYYYCPPEINQFGKSNISEKSDIFSLGIILYELIAEQRAWKKQKGGIDVYNLVHSNNYSFFMENSSTGNKEIDSLILDCVKCDQKERPTAEELLKKIKKINF